ncbi:Vacuolar protein sorting-associated protein [Entamoeba marina]
MNLISINLTNESSFHKMLINKSDKSYTVTCHESASNISGVISIVKPLHPINHQGIRLEFNGYISIQERKTNKFCSQNKHLSPPSTITNNVEIPFELSLNAPLDSYLSNTLTVVYYLEIQLLKTSHSLSREIFIKSFSPRQKKVKQQSKLSNGDLSINITINSLIYHTKDIIKGNVVIEKNNPTDPIQTIQLMLKKIETIDEKVRTTKFNDIEILDGEPPDKLDIPFKMYLSPLHLSPSATITSFTIQYSLELMVITKTTRYHKNWDIQLYRKKIRTKKKKEIKKKSKPSEQTLSTSDIDSSQFSSSSQTLNDLLREQSSSGCKTPIIVSNIHSDIPTSPRICDGKDVELDLNRNGDD